MQFMPLVYGVVLPLIVALFIWALLGRIFAERKAISSATALLGAFICAQWALSGVPTLPPSEASQWLGFVLPLVALASVCRRSEKLWWQWLPITGLILGLWTLQLNAMINYHWQKTSTALIWLGSFTLVALVHIYGFRRLSAQIKGGRTIWFFAAGLFIFQAGFTALSGSVLLAQLNGVMAVCLGIQALLPKGSVAFHGPVAEVVAIALVSLGVLGFCYANLPWHALVTTLIAVIVPSLINRNQPIKTNRLIAALGPNVLTLGVLVLQLITSQEAGVY